MRSFPSQRLHNVVTRSVPQHSYLITLLVSLKFGRILNYSWNFQQSCVVAESRSTGRIRNLSGMVTTNQIHIMQ
ncbi:hypothetical protein DPMN_158371 [Dreissena polymorpha]|uniref:Uncharacterized protein n=1 Tax=Dreissena polymorpha TaxID=45954 RepID=A0A9D4EJQ4_DREPO|nr:hypothetical protein DPMN_158371 [Dreissena polymorpha]